MAMRVYALKYGTMSLTRIKLFSLWLVIGLIILLLLYTNGHTMWPLEIELVSSSLLGKNPLCPQCNYTDGEVMRKNRKP